MSTLTHRSTVFMKPSVQDSITVTVDGKIMQVYERGRLNQLNYI